MAVTFPSQDRAGQIADLGLPKMRAIYALLAGAGVTAAAREAGCHRNTVYRWMREDELFKALLRELRMEIQQEQLHRFVAMGDRAADCVERCLAKGDGRLALQLADRLGMFDSSIPYYGRALADCEDAVCEDAEAQIEEQPARDPRPESPPQTPDDDPPRGEPAKTSAPREPVKTAAEDPFEALQTITAACAALSAGVASLLIIVFAMARRFVVSPFGGVSHSRPHECGTTNDGGASFGGRAWAGFAWRETALFCTITHYFARAAGRFPCIQPPRPMTT